MNLFRGPMEFLKQGFSRQEERRISFRFDYTYADIDPDADLGPLSPKNYTVIEYRIPELTTGTVVVADVTNREWPLLWSEAGARYGDDVITRDSVDLSTLGYVRVCRNKKGMDGLYGLNELEAIEREFMILDDVGALPPRETVSFIVRSETGEAYCEYYGDWRGEISSDWIRYGVPYGCSYRHFGDARNEDCYILSGWIPKYYPIWRDEIVNFAKVHCS